ncbi:MAG: hypothetical protein AUH85_15855 [Chloroflexi bacterium 13_1_40CM_4_68_4]|nr:MAG: hypothetical protein AUH85_15855 [Chloroflexi bacterium 13_1_40CM_4_68_4]
MAQFAYGGQAVIEGVVIRGMRTIGLAVRKPSGAIYRYREPIDSPLQRSRFARLPFVRGVIVLWESLVIGVRMLMRSANVALEDESVKLEGGSAVGFVVATLAIALVLFVGLPYLATQAIHGVVTDARVANILEGALRMALFLGYVTAISLLPDVRRVFAYHGAEHMTIHAFEHGDPLQPSAIEKYPTAHPRCGTAFLLLVVVVSIIAFAFLERSNPIVALLERLVLVIPVAAISYEVLRIGARHESSPLMRILVWPGLLLQRITTRQPTRPMIEVAIASLEEALAGDGEQRVA